MRKAVPQILAPLCVGCDALAVSMFVCMSAGRLVSSLSGDSVASVYSV